MTAVATCSECGYHLKLRARSQPGQRVVCPGCDSSLVIVSLNPPELDLYDISALTSPKNGKRKSKDSNDVTCPACGKTLRMNFHFKPEQGITCPSCRTELKVVEMKPLELDVA